MDLLINALCITVGIVVGLIITIVLFLKLTIWIVGFKAQKMKRTAMKTVSPKEKAKFDNIIN